MKRACVARQRKKTEQTSHYNVFLLLQILSIYDNVMRPYVTGVVESSEVMEFAHRGLCLCFISLFPFVSRESIRRGAL